MQNVMERSPNTINSGLEDIICREKLMRMYYIPITVGHIIELKLTIVPIIMNMVIQIVLMGLGEIKKLPGVVNND